MPTLQDQYNCVRERAARLKDALMHQLAHLLSTEAVTLAVPMEGRVKEWSSIEEKLTRKAIELKSVVDLDDLIGVRTILLFRHDVATVDKLLRTHLTILQSENTASRLNETQFGYQSQHYIANLPSSWLQLPSYGEFADLKVEIQLRTAAQHIWAAASHKLQYKQETSVPPPLRRSIHRVSALLETVDLEFDRLLDERRTYVEQDVKANKPNELLNVDIAERILSELLPPINKTEGENYSELLDDLLHFDITTASDLRKLLVKHKAAVELEDAKLAAKKNRSHFFSHVGLTRQALRQEVGGKEVTAYHEQRKKSASSRRKPATSHRTPSSAKKVV